MPTAKEVTGRGDVTGGTWRAASPDRSAWTRPSSPASRARRPQGLRETSSLDRYMKERGFGTTYLDAAGFTAHCWAHEAQTRQVMEASASPRRPEALLHDRLFFGDLPKGPHTDMAVLV